MAKGIAAIYLPGDDTPSVFTFATMQEAFQFQTVAEREMESSRVVVYEEMEMTVESAMHLMKVMQDGGIAFVEDRAVEFYDYNF